MRSTLICFSLVLVGGAALAQTVDIDNFDSYASSTELRQNWAIGVGSAAAASVSLFTTDATTMPNSMALDTGNLPGFGDSSSARIDFSPPAKFLEGSLTFAFNVTPVTTRPAAQFEVDVILASGANRCTVNTTRPAAFDVWVLVNVPVGASCDMVDLAAVTDLTVQVRYRGPNNNVSAFVLFDSIAISDAVPVELMHFEVE